MIAIIKERENAKKEEEKRLRMGGEYSNDQRGNMRNISPEMMQQFQSMRGQGRARDTVSNEENDENA